MSPKNPHVGRAAARSLERYREKRSASRTPEPFGRAIVSGQRFVVQKHAARLLHYDFRLEWNGVLLSWAVPKGPSLDPADKRFAVAVEDHPVDYVDFEGVIPEKNYGAGEVIVWDKGRWQPIEDPDEGLVAGKLSFVLHGYKLRGEFALVRTKQKSNPNGKEWLLLKHQDAFVQVGAHAMMDESSVLSGLTLEEIADGVPKARAVVAAVASRPKKLVDGAVQTPMLCEPSDPFSDPKYGFELKFDGFRLFGEKRDGAIALHYRRKMVATHLYPEIVLALSRLPYDAFLLDGEVTVSDAAGMPSFPRLQERALLSARTDIEKASIERPATFNIFDLLSLDGRDVRDLPLVERKALLQAMLPSRGPLRFVEHIVERGRDMFEAVRQMGLEGVVGKKLDSKYTGTRSAHWKKVRISHEADVAIVGLQESETVGRAAGARSFHMAALDDKGVWRYVGRVGNGFVDAELQQLRARVESARRDKPICQGTLPSTVPRGRGHLWSDPVAVAVVSWKTFSKDGILREPVFHRLREDKEPEDCRWEQLVATAPIARLEPAPPQAVAPEEKSVSLSNAKKIFWPEKKLTKGDLFAYYDAIAPWILPYLKDRPVMLTRFPDGIHGKSFFQKDAPSWTPSWVRTELMWNEDSGRQIHHFVIDDRETLLYVANLGAIPLHLWSSRVGTLEQPDWSILDLDPKGAPFTDVIEVARVAYALCEEIGLPSFCKTSGSSGLHVMIPLGKLVTHEQSRQLAHLLATEIARRIPSKATLARVIGDRDGKVYLDYLQNGHGKLLAGPLAARPVVAATVSMPLRWSEVVPSLDPSAFDLASAPKRMQSLGADPLLPVLTTVPDLMGSLERLAKLAGGPTRT